MSTTTFSVSLDEARTEVLIGLTQSHPALRPHAVHLAAVRVGLRSLEADPDLLLEELEQVEREREVRRAARRASTSEGVGHE